MTYKEIIKQTLQHNHLAQLQTTTDNILKIVRIIIKMILTYLI